MVVSGSIFVSCLCRRCHPRLHTCLEPQRLDEDVDSVCHATGVEIRTFSADVREFRFCFIKYATTEEADRAIAALHNQYTLPGAVAPLQVRYADGDRERHGPVEDKLFVASLNQRATEQEIAEV